MGTLGREQMMFNLVLAGAMLLACCASYALLDRPDRTR